ncbi:Signal transduction histidine kinase [Catalinimonas alkaloidigena]|uniref:histidine kinase n=1 Tax=Catalinimonas alkaloidigena TaxID=1075417 RepID=A0A1G9T705_9BACT|nr:response regulator [Catalinimonas alkaloidigena]SDM43529.1 Signal transduction histidine kinase [Catalinimonas alkaloidigena]
MNFLKNLKIREKLVLLIACLLIPLLVFVLSTIQNEITENKKLQEEYVQLAESEKISTLIHAFQNETAFAFIAAETDADSSLAQAQTQRNATDIAGQALQTFLDSTGRSLASLALLNDLHAYRRDLDRKTLDTNAFRRYASDVTYSFLDRMDANASDIGNLEIGRQLSSFRDLTDAKVQLGRIRSLLMRTLPAGQFSHTSFARFSTYHGFFEQSLRDFQRYASPADVADLTALTDSQRYKSIAQLFLTLNTNPQLDLSTLAPSQVNEQLAAGIDGFRQIEGQMIQRIKDQVDAEINQKRVNLILLATVLLGVLGLTGLLSLYLINLIANSLYQLKNAADRIRMGATDVTLRVTGTDEIGQVADSFRGVMQKNKALSQVAQAIGEGHYAVEVDVQSDEDVLSHALREMRDKLHQFSLDNTHRNWTLTGISDLNNLITTETTLESVTSQAVKFLCEYTASEAGLVYLHHDDGQLTPAAAYGINYRPDELPAFRVGVGKVGQAASEQRVKVLEDVEDAHLKISTGLADLDPGHLIILPLHFSDTVVGVLELCARRPYTPVQQRFLETASERMAVVLHTLKSHLQTQELLYETQNQAEELETQQEELRQLNAELKASEEELRVNQEELQEKNAELEEKAQLLDEQFEALQNKNKALEDARAAIELKIQQVETVSQYKSDFLANMSHELRTPLNSILILSRLLADNNEKNLSSKQIDHAQIIHKSGNDLLKLINEILDLSKIESGMIRLELAEIPLDAIRMEPYFREMAARKNIRFHEHSTPDGVATITTDRFRLEQILKNFIGNAIKFTDEGGEVELSIHPVRQRPAFRSEQLQAAADVIAFSVRDSGIGIPKEKQNLVFEAFQQADSSTTRKYGGTGLGLTINKELAALLGGELALESEPGVGSTFTLYLPRIPATTDAAPAEQPAAPRPVAPAAKPLPPPSVAPVPTDPVPVLAKAAGVQQVFDTLQTQENDKKQISVLIIEDDKGFSDILADFARAKNFKVAQAHTGTEGLTLARAEKPDAILLDIHLPDTTGWEVLQQIRQDPDLRYASVHVMSAYDKEVTGDFHEHEEYLPKPVTLEMLNKAFATIADVTDRSIETILIVEDNEVENQAIAELLRAHGLKSVSAFSAEAAEKTLAKRKIDCVILDLNLPGMKGYEWMQRLRANRDWSDLPIIIYSGKDLSEEEETRLKEFANTIIIKNEYSYLRLLDEVQLFLHKVNQKLPLGNAFQMKLHVPEEVLQHRKVLVVDDDVRNVYSLSSLLELHGMEVQVAYDGQEALQKLEAEHDIDVVLMDVMMPEMDGIEATKQIRQHLRLKHLPIIALTAKAMKEDREKCLRAGASDYISKPVDTDKLLTLLRVWLYEG